MRAYMTGCDVDFETQTIKGGEMRGVTIVWENAECICVGDLGEGIDHSRAWCRPTRGYWTDQDEITGNTFRNFTGQGMQKQREAVALSDGIPGSN